MGGLEDLVMCPLCFEKLYSPRMLPCQHTFCLSCLESQHRGGPIVTCPICQQQTQLTSDLSSLPSNLYIDSLLQLLHKTGSQEHIASSSSGRKQDDLRCIQCQTVCEDSANKCQHCKQLFCEVCWEGHTSELRSQLISLNVQLQTASNRLEHRLQDVKDRFEQLNQQITLKIEEQIAILRNKESMLQEETKSLLNKEEISAQMLGERVKEVKDLIAEKDAGFFNTEGHEKVATFMTLHKTTGNVISAISSWGEDRVIFDHDNLKIDYNTESGQRMFEPDEVDTNGFKIQDDLNPLENVETLSQYYKCLSSTPRFSFNKSTRPVGVCLSPWQGSYIYVCASDVRLVLLIDRARGKIIQRLIHEDMMCPHGVCIGNKAEEIYVSDKWKHCIHVFNKNGEYLRCMGTKGEQAGQFKSPEGIALDNMQVLLYVCDTGNDRIQAIDAANGQLVHQFGLLQQSTMHAITEPDNRIKLRLTEMNSPTGIAVVNDKVYVADSGNRRIKIYTLTGEKIFEFGSLGLQKGQFRSPEVVAVDPLGFIIVGDSGNARLQIFRPNGVLVRTFSAKGLFRWISGICITPKLEIIVTDNKSHSIHVF